MKILICLLFICLSTASFNMTVGYLKRFNITDDTVKCKLLQDYTKDELEEKTNGDINLEIDCQEHNYEVDNILDKLKEYYEKNITLIYTFCEEVILSEEVEEFIGERDMLIWCFNYFPIGKCTRRYIMGNTLVTIIETSIIFINLL